ncbi:MAG: glycosyltransferase family 39 protein, partial [Planctomycetes bacterium]|nr:glycosyltransferase family 39 protein [Planctomycetota bacterium]
MNSDSAMQGQKPDGPHRPLRTLAAIILIGTLLRAIPILWGTTYWNPVQYNFHPDEPKIVRQVDDFPKYLSDYHDFRYPHFLHMTYGMAWWAIGGAFDLRDDEVSMPGVPGYERTLVFGRILNTLIFGAGGMLLLWLFAKRMFDSRVALFAVAATSIQGWVVASTPLVQTDVPAAFALLAVFYVLLRLDRSPLVRTRQGWLVGILMGVAIAMKYPAGIGWVGVAITALCAPLRKACTWRQALGFLTCAALGCVITFAVFVPGCIYDFESFQLSLQWEFQSKMQQSRFRWADFFDSLFICLPLWILIPACAGWVLSLRKLRTVTPWSIAVCLVASVLISAKAFRPDYAVSLMPFAAVFSGYALWRLADWKPIGRAAAVSYLLAGHLFVGYVVYQRYAGETRYTSEAWIQAHIEPGPLG